jgi:hypothetical protein
MHPSASRNQSHAGPRRPGRHDRDDESLDEAPQLLEDEAEDIEQANLIEENESVEEIENAEESPSRVFDEGQSERSESHE